ncbi:MAG: hypothetical protein ABI346_04420 [Candidatus Baltobacteraceae bacterium]
MLVWLAVGAALGASAPSSAQGLARLHVRSITMRVEPMRVRVGEVVRLRIAIRLDERVARLNDVTLPELSGFVALGDERRCVPEGAGTLCSETLSLSPTAAGVRTIVPVTLDAVDARNGRPSRFGSNSVRLDVLPAAARSQLGMVANALRSIVRLGGLVVLVGAFVYALLRLRRRRVVPPAVASVTEPHVTALEDAGRWQTLLDDLRARPSRPGVLALRGMLRERLGATENETFGDLAGRRAGANAPGLLEALRLIERAAFVDDTGVAGAISDALPALERLATSPRTGPG